MWNLLLIINSAFLSLATIFFIYSVGAALILGAWKQLLVAFLILAFLALIEIVLGALNM